MSLMYPSYFRLQVRWLVKFVPNEFVTRLPSSCNSNYLGYNATVENSLQNSENIAN